MKTDLKDQTPINFDVDQVLFSIRKDGECIGYIEVIDNILYTSGQIGENQYINFVELIKGLQGFDIKIDNFYW
jgi:hypothetical protein